MRLWSLHPQYLDQKGLVALWREGLLAQKVLENKTRGYKNHPQLLRFKQTANPLSAIASYLTVVQAEADNRGYCFDAGKILFSSDAIRLTITTKQLQYEYRHLLNKLQVRDPDRHQNLMRTKTILPHPLFQEVAGDIADWEKVYPSST